MSETPAVERLTQDERAELERLRAEVTALRTGQPVAAAGPARRGRAWLRTTAAVLLVLLGCLLAPLSVVAVWANSQVTDTNRYVETVAPIASDPAVQAAVTDDITNRIFTAVDVNALATQAVDTIASNGNLPPALVTSLRALVRPLSDGVTSFVHDQVSNVVKSQAFTDAWIQANRVAHQEVVGALTGESTKSVTVRNGQVSIDIAPVIAEVKSRLVARGFSLAEKIPTVNATFVVYDSPDITKVQRGLGLLNTLGTWLPIIGIAVLAAGVYVARNHRLALIGVGLGVAAATLLAGIALMLARSAYIDAVPADRLPPDAAGVLFDNLVRFLREGLRALGVLGLVVALGAFFTGPSVTAVNVRSALVRGIARLRRGIESIGLHLGAVTRWAAPKRTWLRAAVVLIAVAVLIIWNYPSPALVAWLAVGVLGGLFVVQLLVTTEGQAPPRQRQAA